MAEVTIHDALQIALQHHQAGQLTQAEQLYRQILAQQPNHADALNLLGLLVQQNGQTDIAVDLIRQAIALKPNDHRTHSHLGIVLREAGRLDEAIAAYRRAIALRFDYPEAHNNLANALKDNGQLDEAIAGYRQTIALKPDLPEAHSNLGNALKDKGQLDDAIAAYRQSIALNPALSEARSNLGIALAESGQLEEAIATYRQTLALNPGYTAGHDNLVYALHFHPDYDARAIAQEHVSWRRRHAEPLKEHIRPCSNDCNPDRRLRIGYVSPDFRDHVVGRNLLPLFRQHDHQQFDITCYGQIRLPDATTAVFQQHADRWRNIAGVSDERVAELIRTDGIDILVDLTLHMTKNRLLVFARKPAPVQVTFAGYPASTGLSAIDYRLSDPYLDPPGMDESVYSERTIRLPDSFWCYDPLECRDIPVNSLPALNTGAVTFGCLNNSCKINDPLLKMWAQVLRRTKYSRLILRANQGSQRQRILDILTQEGVEPSRVEFLAKQPRQQYLRSYHRIDLGLDTFPYGGHTTSLDSLWMGVPVVTLVGQTAVSRAGWCQLSNLGLTELAGQTPEDFVRIAVALAGDLPRLQELRSTLRGRMEQSPLMDAPRFARNIETAYRTMWRNWCGGITGLR